MIAAMRAIGEALLPPTSDGTTAMESRRARTVSFFTLLFAACGLVYALVYHVVAGLTSVSVALLTATAIGILAPLVLRVTGSVTFTANYLVVQVFWAVTYVISRTGGHESVALAWYVTIPIAATLLLGRRWGVVWLLASFSLLYQFAISDYLYPAPEEAQAREQIETINLFLLLGLFLALNGLAFLYDRVHERALQQLHAANRRLEATNAALESARRAAESSSRAKSEFLANMSHEIRTPMTSILGFAETLLDGGVGPEERESAVRTIRRNGEHLLRILNDVLDLSRIEAGRIAVEEMECSPVQVVAQTESLLGPRAEEKGLSLRSEFEGRIPRRIRSDPTRLRQILINLVGNAIKFTESGGVRVVVRYLPDDERPRVQFDVVDTGIGIDQTRAKRLFEPFTQGDASTTRRFGGSGLGLAISSRLATLLRGDLRVVPQAGRGSRFRLTIPTGPVDAASLIECPAGATALESATASEDGGPEPALLGGIRVLLAEDGPDNQRLIAHFLRTAGAEVCVADNGAVAAERALEESERGSPFDAILMDMQMPVLDGYAAARLLRGREYDGPIIALTAHAMAEDRERCLRAGCDDYVSKPIDWSLLTRRIGELITGRRREARAPGSAGNHGHAAPGASRRPAAETTMAGGTER